MDKKKKVPLPEFCRWLLSQGWYEHALLFFQECSLAGALKADLDPVESLWLPQTKPKQDKLSVI